MNYSDLYSWFTHHKRDLPWRETRDAYKIWISEIILQQTRVNQGIAYYYRFIEAFPTVEDLARASEDRVLRLWQGLGYYSRARNLHRAARMMYEGKMYDVRRDIFPKTYEEMRKLPGVGDYTAGAIAAFAYNLPYPALDGNVYRVLSRLTNCAIAFDTTAGKKLFHHVAEELLDKENPRLFNSAIMELGALHCVPTRPDCASCPLRYDCQAYQHGTVEELPVRKVRPQLQDRYLNYTVYIEASDKSDKGTWRTLIHQRQEKDIWQHLYEFVLEESESLKESPLHLDFTHILSHRRLHARFHIEYVDRLPQIADTVAVSWAELDEYALSRLTLKAIEAIADL